MFGRTYHEMINIKTVPTWNNYFKIQSILSSGHDIQMTKQARESESLRTELL